MYNHLIEAVLIVLNHFACL